MTGTMKCECSHCGTLLGSKPCVPEMDGKTTSGICNPCFAREMCVALGLDLFDRIQRSNRAELTLLVLTELQSVESDSLRLSLRQLAAERQERLRVAALEPENYAGVTFRTALEETEFAR